MSALLNVLLRLSLTGGVTCLVCLTASTLLRNKMPKAWLYCLWLVVTISFLVPAPINLRLPVPQIRFPAASDSSASVPADGALGKSTSNTAFSVQDPAAIQPPIDKQSQMPANGPSGIDINTGLIIAVIWMAGAGGMFLWFVTGYCLTAGKLKKGRDLLTSGRIPVYENAAISTPLLVGLLRPVIYLPKDFKNPELAVRHELCHWHRGDIWSKWFVQLTVCIHWFNPMAYLMKRELNRLSELACDEAVIRDMDEAGRQAYGQMLLDTLRVSSDLGGPMIAVVGDKKQWLRERLYGIMDKRRVTKKSVASMAALVVCLVGTAILSGGFLLGCSGNGTAVKKDPTVSADTIAATDAIPSVSASYASLDVSPSADGSIQKVYVLDVNGEAVQKDDNEKLFTFSVGNTTKLDDTEISKRVCYKIVFPETLIDGLKLEDKSLGVGLGQKFDYATTKNSDFNNAVKKAIMDDSAFDKLLEYDPYRFCSADYVSDTGSTVFINTSKTRETQEGSSTSEPTVSSAVTEINSIKFSWNSFKFPTYHVKSVNGLGFSDMTQPPIKIDTRNSLTWTINGVSYLLGTLNDTQITQKEAVDLAEQFMKAQGG